MNDRIENLLAFIYGSGEARGIKRGIERLAAGYAGRAARPPASGFSLDERDAILITYGDQLREPGAAPLRTLRDFAARYLDGVVPGVHILPFFPYTSDDGFSISDYRSVNPDLGDWGDVEAISGSFRLMADIVLNHCSASHPWFKGFLSGDRRYRDYFITVPAGTDLSAVARPRALPLLTPFETAEGRREVWTTFSEDQVDLNFANPAVLLEMVELFFELAARGVRIIRLDAIAYLWKQIGTSCIHHPKTHAVVKLFRAVIDEYAPWIVLITETNVPQAENLSYFGNGEDEAHLVYQFSLPPLAVDAFLRGDAGHLRAWAAALPPPTTTASYFNFLASHDGIGLLPAHGFLSESELEGMTTEIRRRGGLISYKSTPTGEIPYEMNVSYRDAVAEARLDEEARARKFLASQALLLSLAGVPGIYVHSLIGSGNYLEGVTKSGRNRAINREKLDYRELRGELEREGSLRNLVYRGYRSMLAARRAPAFNPGAAQRVLPAEGGLFALERTALPAAAAASAPAAGSGVASGPVAGPGAVSAPAAGAGPAAAPRPSGSRVLCLINTSGGSALFRAAEGLGLPERARDRISGRMIDLAAGRRGERQVELRPWEVLWLEL